MLKPTARLVAAGALCALAAAGARADQVYLTELMYHPPAGLPEFIEIQNATATPFDIAEWEFTDGISYVFPPFSAGDPQASFLHAFETVLVSGVSEAQLRAAYPGIPATVRVFGPWTGSLANEGERVTLADKNGLTRTTVDYDDRGRFWPLAADGAGHSLTLVSLYRSNDDRRNWTASQRRGGTPGAPAVGAAEEPVSNPEVDLSVGIPYVEYGDAWRFHDQNQDLGTAWKDVGYDDSGWAQGPGLFGFESSGLPAPGIQTPMLNSSDAANHLTYYLRTEFAYQGETSGTTITIDQIVDDGAAYYLNGQELGRVGVPAGAGWNTPANRVVGDANIENAVIQAPGSALVQGTNVLAAEVHQTNASSSDCVFGARLSISVPTAADLLINEVLPDESAAGYVELHNPGGAPIDLNGYYLSDNPSNLTMHQISGAATIPAGGLGVVGFAEAGLSAGDPVVVYLTDPDGTTVINAVSTSMPLDGRSIGRKPAGSGSWFLFVDPTRGTPNQSQSDLARELELSEVHFADGAADWIEIHSRGAAAIALDGLVIASRRDLSDSIALSGSIAAGGFVSVDTAFPLENDGDVMLFLADGSGNILKAAALTAPDAADTLQADFSSAGLRETIEWFPGAAPTRNAANDPARNVDIVINEVGFSPPSEQRSTEFIELFNHGSSTVDLSGWEFVEGIDFTFPAGTTVAPGGFAVVASHANAFAEAYPGVSIAGVFSGALANRGELLRLVDAGGSLVDEVDYLVGGDWPRWTNSDGSALELVHPSLDNSAPSAWRGSDETQTAAFTPFSVTGVFRQLNTSGGASDYKELHFHLVGDAHVELRNIQLRPAGGGGSILSNADQMSTSGSGATGWLAQGTHAQSFVENGVLHLISDGHGDNRANRAEIDATGLSAGASYTLSFEARWVYGKGTLIAQTWDHSLGGVFFVPIPEDLGTPGAANSAYQDPPPPQIDDLRHDPPVPGPGQPVRVTARVTSAAPPTVMLRHRPDSSGGNAAWNGMPMRDDGLGGDDTAADGIFTATIGSYTSSGAIAQFYVEATAPGMPPAVLPRPGASRPAMWVVASPASGNGLRTTRFVVSAADLAAISQGDGNTTYPRLSNHYKNMTLIIDEREIYYGAEVRNSGSPWTRGNNLSRGKWKPPGDKPFRGAEKRTFDNDASNNDRRHNNRLMRYWLYLLGHAENEGEFVNVIVNSGSADIREEVEPVANDFLRRNWENGTDGELYRIDDEWWFTDSWSRSSRNADWRHKGTDEAIRYHTEWMKRSREEQHDYTALTNFFRVVQPSSGAGNYTQEMIERILDPEAVTLMAAVRGYGGDWDSFTLNRGKNGYFYRRPDDGKFQFLWWDSDLAFQNTGEVIYNGMTGFRPWIDKPYNKRRLHYYLAQIVDRYSQGSARMAAWFQAEEDASNAFTMNAGKYNSWFSGRLSRAQAELGANYTRSFTISTGNGNSATTSDPVFALNGLAPTTAFSGIVVGHPEATFTWTSDTAWRIDGIELASGANPLTVRLVDHDGDTVEERVFTATLTGNAPPVAVLAASPGSWHVPFGQPLLLDLSASREPDGEALAFSFGAGGGATVIENGPIATVMFPAPGLYGVTGLVEDPAPNFDLAAREAAVFSPADFSSFGGSVLDPEWTARNLTRRGNSPDGSWYSLDTLDGRLLVRVGNDKTYPMASSSPISHPFLHRPLPDDSGGGAGQLHFAIESDVRLESAQFLSATIGVMVEFDNGGAVARHWIGLQNGIRIATSAGPNVTWSRPDGAVRIVRRGDSLSFDVRIAPGDWQTVATAASPAATDIRGGVFASTSEAAALKVSFDYALVIDPDIDTIVRDSLRVTEVMANPAGGSDLEFIELTNTGAVPISLAGVSFGDGAPFAQFTFGDFILQPGESTVVVANQAAFEARYGTGIPIAGQWASGRLDNAGEQVSLFDAAGNEVASFDYGSGGDWPARASGRGSSLEAIDPHGDLSDASNWRASSEIGGSPGGAGLGPDIRIAVNEVLTHTDAPLSDAIELANRTSDAIDLTGWYLSDSFGTLNKFRIPDGTLIPAHGYLVFTEVDFNPTPGNPQPHHFALSSSSGEDVVLTSPDESGAPARFVDDVAFPAAPNGESLARWPDLTGTLAPAAVRTLGAANLGPRVGPVVISEVMYAPPSGAANEEFIEIFNPTPDPVDLSGWRIAGGVDFEFPPGTSAVPAGGAVVVVAFDPAADPAARVAFESAYGLGAGSIAMAGGFGPARLDNAGESLTLQRPDDPPAEAPGTIPLLTEDEAVWLPAAPWPASAAGAGDALVRLGRTHFGRFASSWTGVPATPGTVDVIDTVAAWLGHFFPTGGAGSGLADDHDLDGWPNVLEYPLQMDPLRSNPHPLTIDGGTISFTVDTARSDVSVTLERSSDAALWQTVSTEIISSENGIEVRSHTPADTTGPPALFRLRASE